VNTKILEFVKNALNEDIGRGDLFSLCLDSKKKLKAHIIAKQEGVFAGLRYAKILCKYSNIKYKFLKEDGDKISLGDEIVHLKGKECTLLGIERVLLNILQHSCGIATQTNKLVSKSKNLKILDTRKTRPLLREFEKYSVRCGGGFNHRMGLDDTLMLKDTHLANIDNLEIFIKNARECIPWTAKIECECDSYKYAKKALKAKVDIIMCDNMAIENIKKVIELKNDIAPWVLVEASGNITIDNIGDYVDIGLDAISTGSIVHQAKWLDFSMKIFTKK